MNVYEDIQAERLRQVTKGRDAAHDDVRSHTDWIECLGKVIADQKSGGPSARAMWIKVASVAVAAVDAIDRAFRPRDSNAGETDSAVMPSKTAPLSLIVARDNFGSCLVVACSGRWGVLHYETNRPPSAGVWMWNGDAALSESGRTIFDGAWTLLPLPVLT
jgi:hypothetical protein